MYIFFNLLDICTKIACAIIVLYIIILIYALFSHKKESVSWRDITPSAFLRSFFPNSICITIFLIVFSIGSIWGLCNIFLSNTIIGSPFEKNNYSASYDAHLDFNGKDVFCIAQVDRISNDGNSSYYISAISLPFGKTIDNIDTRYTPDEDNYIDISFYASGSLHDALNKCHISVGSPATDTSRSLLQASVISTSGEFCASRKSDLYHTLDCPYASQISPENFIYFSSYEEAEFFGYSCHEECFIP